MAIPRRSVLLLVLAGAVSSACATGVPYAGESCSSSAMPLRAGELQIERGRRKPVMDAFGHYLFSLPSKLLLLSWRVNDHSISAETEAAVAEYLDENRLCHVKVRLNQYAPRDEWSRLVRNGDVHGFWRYTLGGLSVAIYTALPQRLLAGFPIPYLGGGGDHYNPYTNTIHIFSDIPAVALHEGGHAKDLAPRHFKGLYSASRIIPLVPLYQEAVASNDAISYLRHTHDSEGEREADVILWSAYSTYIFGYVPAAPLLVFPVAWAAKAAGWVKSLTVPEPDPDPTAVRALRAAPTRRAALTAPRRRPGIPPGRRR